MEWWRKAVIALSILLFFNVIIDEIILINMGYHTMLDGILAYLVFGFISLYLYNGQFEGYDHYKTNKLSKVIYIVTYPSLFCFSIIMRLIFLIAGRLKRS